MRLSNGSLNKTNDTLKVQLFETQARIKQLEYENSDLKTQNQAHLNEIKILKQQIQDLLSERNNAELIHLDTQRQHANNKENEDISNCNNAKPIQWNFSIVDDQPLLQTSNSDNVCNNNPRKRPRADMLDDVEEVTKEEEEEEEEKEEAIDATKPEIAKPSSSTASSLNPSASISRSASVGTVETATDILEKRLPTHDVEEVTKEEEEEEEEEKEEAIDAAKPQIAKPSSSTASSLNPSASISRSASVGTVETATDILEKRLPTQLDLIRGDILAEAGCTDQVLYCFGALSKASTEEWQLRNFLMQMVCGLVEENKSLEYSVVYDSKQIIKKQLTDLRSAIVKTACEMLIAFSKYCDSNKFGQCLAFFIPIHLQGLYVTIAVIRDAHNQCLTQCISNAKSFKCMSALLKGLNNKHCEVRVKVINLLSLLLLNSTNNEWNNFNDKRFEKYAEAISDTIKTYIGDSKSGVRNAVKQLFENFAKVFPERASKLLGKMNLSQQKTLKKCIGNRQSAKTQRKVSSKLPKTRKK
eukprot:CAMPEP_0197073014 /NCGR_PEP_ID=MMETSP1384-20130603/210386_1 /TAXON_ID=29189 /ORGANISM="Ammonia sp." /LENGTH=527 /DNA_ID=CAMNT_0042511839 /DNA_START=226 /DNA_END=1809 /DNA_ORIENTATION=+